MWDDCGIGLCPLDHVKKCVIFTGLHHFDIFLNGIRLVEWSRIGRLVLDCHLIRGLVKIGTASWQVGGLVRISIGLKDLQWIGGLAMDMQISTWEMY